MYSRGPYKRYRIDDQIPVPRRTDYRIRQHQWEYVQDQDDELYDPQENINMDNDILAPPSEAVYQYEYDVVNSHLQDSQDTVPHEDCSESSGDCQHDQMLNMRNANEPIYPGAHVTCAQSVLLLVAFLLKHKLTDVALTDLLDVLNLFLPSTFPQSKYKFYKTIHVEDSQVHFYCSSCLSYMGTSKGERDCEDCGTKYCFDESMKNGTFFLHIPLEGQLKQLLSDPTLYSCLTNRDVEELVQSNVIFDVTTAKLYQNLINHHGMSGNDFSFTWNADGIPVFKSSQYSIWPVQCMLNELPKHLRASNILLTGLWFGRTKPNMNTFLVPFVEECRKLEEEGFFFEGDSTQRKAYAVVCSSDSPARAMLRNCKQFNGKFGCDFCEHEGVAVAHNRGPPTRYYPQRGEQTPRTSQRQAEHGARAEHTLQAVQGVKGISIIDVLPTFDTVNGFTPEYMHSVCQGVIRQVCKLWFDSSNHDEEYYLGRKIELIDERLLAISPPAEITRAPRSIKERKFWKASEWRAFMLYSLVVLHGLLPHVYLKHFFLLVFGVYTLLSDNITEDMLDLAHACLVKFVEDMEDIYGLSSCTFNVHLMTHLTDGVRNCGPLWSTSAYIFEANNHVLLKMFSGTQYVPQQICDTFILSQKLPAIGRECINEDSAPRVKHMFQRLQSANLPTKSQTILQTDVSGLGVGKAVFLSASQAIALSDLIDRDVVNRRAIVYNRFLVNHVLYTSQSYTRSTRHHDSTVQFDSPAPGYGIILGLFSTKPDCSCCKEDLQLCPCPVYNVVFLKVLKCEAWFLFTDAECGVSSYFLKEYTEDHSTVAIFPGQLRMKCINLKVERRNFLCELPSRFYGD